MSARLHRLVFAGVAIATCTAGLTAQNPARATFEPDGTIKVPAFDLPPSPFISAEALEEQKAQAKTPPASMPPGIPPAQMRQLIETALGPQAAATRKRYPVDIVESKIAGVRVRTITPTGKPTDRGRVLINVHGGAFTMCAEACAILESAPVASIGGFKVVTVDYRMAPEHRHPAGVEDVEKVYRELLKTYRPQQIGLFGCSAGGSLTAQAAAWMPAHGLPQFGAIGIFGAGATRSGGDSAYISASLGGTIPAPAAAGKPRADMTNGYFTGSDMKDPIISAALHPAVIAKFPPTLLITGGRASDMTPAIVTNSALIKAGVPSTMIVQEGMGHCYIYSPTLPEARDAHEATVKFFRSNLGVPPRRR